MLISIIGQGYVGLTISVFAAEHYSVVGYDNSEQVVSQLNQVNRELPNYTILELCLTGICDEGHRSFSLLTVLGLLK